MPLMTNPSRQRAKGLPRLRNRSLPRLRIVRNNNNNNSVNQPQHHELEDQDELVVSKQFYPEGRGRNGPTKTRRRSYSLPKRLVTRKSGDREERDVTIESSTSEVEVSTRQRKGVSFDDELVTQKYESPFDDIELEFDPTRVWYQEPDYVRFQKDRILTSFDYQASINGGKQTFDHENHAIRGLEMVIHERYSKKLKWEKKDLWKALQKEEALQKETGKFPNFERFKVVSQRHTKDAKNRATSLAAEDAKEVQGKTGKNWFSRAFGAPPDRGVTRARSLDTDL